MGATKVNENSVAAGKYRQNIIFQNFLHSQDICSSIYVSL